MPVATHSGKSFVHKGGKGKGKGKHGLKRAFVSEKVCGFTRSGLKRLCHRAGSKRIGGSVYKEALVLAAKYLERVVGDSWALTDLGRRCTINRRYVITALAKSGCVFYSATGS